VKAHTATGRYRKGRNSTRRTAHACGGTEHCHRRSRSQKKRRVFSWGRTRDMAKGCRSKGKTGNQERENLATRMRGEGLHLRVLQTRTPNWSFSLPTTTQHLPPFTHPRACSGLAVPIHEAREGTNQLFFFATNKTTRNRHPHATNQPHRQPEKRRRERKKEEREERPRLFFLPTNRTRTRNATCQQEGIEEERSASHVRPHPSCDRQCRAPQGPVKENEGGDEGNRRKEVTRRRAKQQVGRPKEP